jgi:RNA polymerase sigma-70 factor, ECF subfamily
VGTEPGDVTRILFEVKKGSREAQDDLISLVYKELRPIASAHLRREPVQNSLQPTALVHEAYLRLIDIHQIDWQSRAYFFSVASTLMRRVLVDHARTRDAEKRGGDITIWVEESLLPSSRPAPEILALDDARVELARLNERQAKIVEMRFFAGMMEEEGDVLGISVRTVIGVSPRRGY